MFKVSIPASRSQTIGKHQFRKSTCVIFRVVFSLIFVLVLKSLGEVFGGYVGKFAGRFSEDSGTGAWFKLHLRIV